MKIWTPLDTTGSISPHELDDVARMHSKVDLTLNFQHQNSIFTKNLGKSKVYYENFSVVHHMTNCCVPFVVVLWQ